MRHLHLFFAVILLLFTTMFTLSQEETPDAEPTEAITVVLSRPAPSQTLADSGVTVEVLFESLPQGRVGVMHVTGEQVTEARLRFLDRLTDFFPVGGEIGLYGLIVADWDLSPRPYDFSVFVWLDDGTRVTITGQFEVTLGGFIQQDLTVAPDRAYLLDVQVERNEFARLNSVQDDVTAERMWVDGFQLPIASELTSPFGAYRTFNATVESRHTGWDLRAPTGTPVMAAASGRVAFAGLMDIRGNHVIIDHGYGVFSGYSHLSQVHVTRGQSLQRGQIIGVSGNTGRSGGAHLHWEMSVHGEWIDSADFLRTWLP